MSKILILLAVALLAACAPATTESGAEPALPETAMPTAPLAATPSDIAPPVPADTPAVQAAIDDLAAREGIDATEIQVIRAESVTWSDGSLGCPQPDMMYTQALVDGQFIQLQVDDTVYNYHSGGEGDPFLCEGSTAEVVPAAGPEEAMPGLPTAIPALFNSAVLAAQEDLATRLGIRSGDIELIRAESVTWSDGSLGCPQPDMVYTQALVDGLYIQLQAGDAFYNYHSGGNRDPFLCEGGPAVAPGELPPGAVSGGQ